MLKSKLVIHMVFLCLFLALSGVCAFAGKGGVWDDVVSRATLAAKSGDVSDDMRARTRGDVVFPRRINMVNVAGTVVAFLENSLGVVDNEFIYSLWVKGAGDQWEKLKGADIRLSALGDKIYLNDLESLEAYDNYFYPSQSVGVRVLEALVRFAGDNNKTLYLSSNNYGLLHALAMISKQARYAPNHLSCRPRWSFAHSRWFVPSDDEPVIVAKIRNPVTLNREIFALDRDDRAQFSAAGYMFTFDVEENGAGRLTARDARGNDVAVDYQIYVEAHTVAIKPEAPLPSAEEAQSAGKRQARIRELRTVIEPLLGDKLPQRVAIRDEKNGRTVVLMNRPELSRSNYERYRVFLSRDAGKKDLPFSDVEIAEKKNVIEIKSLYLSTSGDYQDTSQGIGSAIFTYFAAYAKSKGKGLFLKSHNYGMLRVPYLYCSAMTKYGFGSDTIDDGSLYKDMDWFKAKRTQDKVFTVLTSKPIYVLKNVILKNDAATFTAEGYQFQVRYLPDGRIDISAFKRGKPVTVAAQVILQFTYFAYIAPDDIWRFDNASSLTDSRTGMAASIPGAVSIARAA